MSHRIIGGIGRLFFSDLEISLAHYVVLYCAFFTKALWVCDKRLWLKWWAGSKKKKGKWRKRTRRKPAKFWLKTFLINWLKDSEKPNLRKHWTESLQRSTIMSVQWRDINKQAVHRLFVSSYQCQSYFLILAHSVFLHPYLPHPVFKLDLVVFSFPPTVSFLFFFSFSSLCPVISSLWCSGFVDVISVISMRAVYNF